MKSQTSPVTSPVLRAPVQVSPIDRTLAATARLAGDGGVVASQKYQAGEGGNAQMNLKMEANL